MLGQNGTQVAAQQNNIKVEDARKAMIGAYVQMNTYFERVVHVNKGKEYLNVVCRDNTGIIDGKVWSEYMPPNHHLLEGQFVNILAEVSTYKGNPVLYIQAITPVDIRTINIYDFCPFYPDAEKVFNDFKACLSTWVKKPHLVELINKFFNLDAIVKSFLIMQGGRNIHHAKISGLLYHTYELIQACVAIALLKRPRLHYNFDIEVLVVAAALHDIGKLKEYIPFPVNKRSNKGILHGHVNLGYAMVYNAIRQIENFPEADEDKVLHCIEASHGDKCSDIKPMYIEAEILSNLDHLDSRIEGMNEFILTQDWKEGEILRYHRVFDKYVCRG